METAGAAFVEALLDNYLVWSARALGASDALSLTVSAQMPDTLFILVPKRITERPPYIIPGISRRRSKHIRPPGKPGGRMY